MTTKKIKEPKRKGIAKTPIIMQFESLECGPASLTMVMAYYNKWVPLEQVRIDCGVSRDGSDAKSISLTAKKYGFNVKGYIYNLKNLMTKAIFPCIIHWNKAHFVVLNGFSKNKKYAYISDPSKGETKLKIDDFKKSYSGIYLEIVPGKDFIPSGEPKSLFSYAKKRLVNAKAAVIFFSVITIVFYLVILFDPIIRQSFVDKILSGNNSEWLVPFILIVAGIGLGQIIVTIIQQIYSLKIYRKLAYEGNSTFMWKILRLPIAFFSQRMTGDIQDRKDSNAKIAETIVNVFSPLILNSVIIIVYLALMMSRNYILTLVGVFFATLNVIVSQLLVKKRINIQKVLSRDSAMLTAATSKGIEMIETIKSSGSEESYFNQWIEYKDAVSNNQRRLAFIKNFYGIIPSLIFMAINYSVLFLGIAFTIEGHFTIGGIVAFQGLLLGFMTPMMSVSTSGQTLQETRTEMERVEDVMNYSDDPNVIKNVTQTSKEKLKSTIKISHLTFGYNKLRDPVIKDFNLSIKEEEKVALVGKTGSGKSTLSKLISGLYESWEGDILFDNQRIIDINRKTFNDSVAVVDQDVFLFEDTLMNNIKMWSKDIKDEDVIQACKDAQIYDKIASLKDGFNYHVLEGGKNLSGGEKQRIEIARALARNPSILILDEATSALDAKTEDNVMKAIDKRHITCIIIAHRLSTIRDADKIVVLDHGKIVETGDHDSLINQKGYYYNLVTRE